MKMTSKILTLVTILFSIIAMSFAASAATNADIISTLKSSNVKAEYIAIANDYLKSNTLTSAQLDAGLANVKSAIALMNAENQTDILKLSATAKTKLVNIVNSTSTQTGITASFGKDTKGIALLKLSSANGTPYIISASDLALKVTGSDNTVSFILLAIGLILITLGSAFIISRKSAVQA